MGIKFSPGLKAAGVDPNMVEKLVEAQKIPLNTAKKRKEVIVQEKAGIDKFSSLLHELEGSLSGLKTRQAFYKLKLDSSHPDILDGTVAPGALLGSYEFEVRSLARSDKQLAYGFPDRDKTPVGFGYMLVDTEKHGSKEVTIEPNSTLEQVASQINDADIGVRAMVVNTRYQPDAFRLLVVSEESGKESKITIDPDTTDLDFKEQVVGRNLDVLFEDVPVTNTTNNLDGLVDNVTFNVRRSEPGTRVQVNIVHDAEATMEGIKAFVTNYNKIMGFVQQQYTKDPDTGKFGNLAGDYSLKMVMRQLQSSLTTMAKSGNKYSTIAEIGITSNPKTGELVMDEAKVKAALSENYEGVANLFIRDRNTVGLAEIMSQKVRELEDAGSGALKNRQRGLEQVIKNQDQEIERRERLLQEKETSIRRKFSALESTLSGLQGQSDYLKARFSGGNGGGA